MSSLSTTHSSLHAATPLVGIPEKIAEFSFLEMELSMVEDEKPED